MNERKEERGGKKKKQKIMRITKSCGSGAQGPTLTNAYLALIKMLLLTHHVS